MATSRLDLPDAVSPEKDSSSLPKRSQRMAILAWPLALPLGWLLGWAIGAAIGFSLPALFVELAPLMDPQLAAKIGASDGGLLGGAIGTLLGLMAALWMTLSALRAPMPSLKPLQVALVLLVWALPLACCSLSYILLF